MVYFSDKFYTVGSLLFWERVGWSSFLAITFLPFIKDFLNNSLPLQWISGVNYIAI